jgi:2,3,4,5-tetrahydropyridine-2-carboxylate N-succinyltransferase
VKLQEDLERLYEEGASANRERARAVFARLREELNAGRVRSAEPDPSAVTGWRVNVWVKKGFSWASDPGSSPTCRRRDAAPASSTATRTHFRSRRWTPQWAFEWSPGGSSIRDGAYVGKGVICVPPMYVNIGAYVGESSLIDSHALVGSCAQVGRRVHISAGAQIGGVIEPVGAVPVIIEDDVLVGGNTGSMKVR